jgi:lipopolysaccharide heptosyltransferase II
VTLRDRLITLLCRFLGLFFPRRPPPRPFAPRSLLIIRSCCLGDVLLATAVVGQVRAALPRTHIAFAVHPFARAAIEGNPHVDEVLECGDIGVPRFRLRDYLRFVRVLHRRRFEAAIVLERSPLVGLLPFLGGVPVRAGLDNLGRGFAHTVRVPCPPDRHRAEIFLDVVRALGLPVHERRLLFQPDETDRRWAQERLSAEVPWAVLAPGGGVNPGTVLTRKRWPAEGYAELARRFLERGWGVVLVGNADDRESTGRVLQLLGPTKRLIDLTGALTWGQLGAVVERGRVFVGNDSGPLHLAMAVGTPTVGLYGPTSPAIDGPFGTTPHAVVYHPLDCSPCFLNGRFRPRRPQADCMLGITVEEVWAKVEGLVGLEAPQG